MVSILAWQPLDDDRCRQLGDAVDAAVGRHAEPDCGTREAERLGGRLSAALDVLRRDEDDAIGLDPHRTA